VFAARDLAPAAGQPEEDESITREWIPLADVPTLIARGELTDAKTIAGLLVYQQLATHPDIVTPPGRVPPWQS
jgi:hypothetical protein